MKPRKQASDFPAKYQKQIEAQLKVKPAKRSKYGNVRTEIIGEAPFDSKLEAGVFTLLVKKHGRKNIIRQVSLPIGKQRVRPDFMVIQERFDDGSFRAELIDAKGHATRDWTAKANHLEDKHGLEIQVITKEEEIL